MDFFKGILLEWLDRCELGWISENAPYGLTRRHDCAGQRSVSILKEREHFLQQQLIGSPQFGERGIEPPPVKRAEFIEQIVDLIFQCDLGEDTDRLSLLKSGLK